MSAEVGFGPKQLQRVFRFHRVLRRLPLLAGGAAVLAEVAADCGYADQSHLGRDCRRLAGTSPADLVASWSRRPRTSTVRNVPDRAPAPAPRLVP